MCAVPGDIFSFMILEIRMDLIILNFQKQLVNFSWTRRVTGLNKIALLVLNLALDIIIRRCYLLKTGFLYQWMVNNVSYLRIVWKAAKKV